MVDSELLGRAEERRVDALATLDAERRARFGQFYTPERAAALIAGMPRLPASGRIRVLDPGAGTGSLAAALVARVLGETRDLETEVVAVEVDPQVVPFLEATLADCVDTAAAQDSKVSTRVVVGDYIDLTTGLLASETALAEPFDLVIMNPPYQKLAASSGHRLALASRGADCPNLYAAFLALGAEALRSGGQLVAITPRSFANGPYFGRFRRFLLDRISIDRLHVFESRSTVFSDTGVLQENVVFSGTRDGIRQRVLLSGSKGHTDEVIERVVAYEDVIRPADPEQFVRISSGDQDTAVADVTAGLPCTLSDLGVEVSTGKVVDFRSRENLRETADRDCVPLVYPGNVTGGIIEWPRAIRKAQGFAVTDHRARRLLVPAGRYVVVKRFSAKEERRRVLMRSLVSGLLSSIVEYLRHGQEGSPGDQ